MKKVFLIITLFILSASLSAQVNFDALLGVWNDENAPDTSRFAAINSIIQDHYLNYQNLQPDSAIYYSKLMYENAKRKGLKTKMANAFNNMGLSYSSKYDYNKALEYYMQSLNILKKNSIKNEMLGWTLLLIGKCYHSMSDYKKAMDYLQKSLNAYKESDFKKGIAECLLRIGWIYYCQSLNSKALEYYLESLNLSEDISDTSLIAGNLINIGSLYSATGDLDKSLKYYKQSLKMLKKTSNKRGISVILNNIGADYFKQKNLIEALAYYQRSLKISKEISNKRSIAIALYNIGDVYYRYGDSIKALEYYQESLKLSNETSYNTGIINSFIGIGNIKLLNKEYKQSIILCEKALKLAEESNKLKKQVRACECLFNTYKEAGNTQKALEYHERITVMNDSLKKEETTKKLQQFEFQKKMLADSLKKEEEKLKVQHTHELEIQKKNRTRNIYIASGLFVVLIATGLFGRLRYTRRSKAIIEREKDRSENLLLNILPSEIAEELKEKGYADARDFDMVSILFTDFNEFTKTSSSMNAKELVAEINTCYKAFDDIIEKHGIEKIKTIGDSYMAAGGLPVPSNDSIQKTIQAALEMQAFIIERKNEKTAKGESCFEMRVGIHTGPVVAGIVGVKKFQYDVWGDTVNIASRMEQKSEVGKVNISHDTYNLIKDNPQFEFESRGKIDVKGKGEMEMFFVRLA